MFSPPPVRTPPRPRVFSPCRVQVNNKTMTMFGKLDAPVAANRAFAGVEPVRSVPCAPYVFYEEPEAPSPQFLFESEAPTTPFDDPMSDMIMDVTSDNDLMKIDEKEITYNVESGDDSATSFITDFSDLESLMMPFPSPPPGMPLILPSVLPFVESEERNTHGPQTSLRSRRKSRRSLPYPQTNNRTRRPPHHKPEVEIKAAVVARKKNETLPHYKGNENVKVVTIRRDADNTFRTRDRVQKVARRPRYVYVKVEAPNARDMNFAFDVYGTASDLSPLSVPLANSVNLPASVVKSRSSKHVQLFRINVTEAIIPSDYSRQGTHFFVLNVRTAGTTTKKARLRLAVNWWHHQK